MVIIRHAVRINGLTDLVVNKLDILSGFEELKIATGYTIHGARVTTLPYDLALLAAAEPIYETLPGWSESIMDVQTLDDLPTNARAYINRIAQLAGVPITTIGVGPEREQVIHL